ncbi:nitrate/nitrite transporter NrtS [Zhongshania borealis]|uniref:Phosphoenolpyruvate protein kinase n=1 Tax=Zhongshania borealis TaxID=889488 RepID=A0ABP7WXH3_9GAMM
MINAFRVSLVVGILLNAINQGTQFINGLDIIWGQVVLNFVVPYCVASYSAAMNDIESRNNDG